ncbi:MAG: hypothetical protein MI974_23145 [Chitinophagales bacterium]|nr:hypothetical protein [Chitinophagales bacterium]
MRCKCLIFLSFILILSCSRDSEPQAIEKDRSETTKVSDEKEKEVIKDQLAPLIFAHCILIVGGSPSLSPELPIDSIYSSQLQYELGSRYQVLNAAVMDEDYEALSDRLHNLPPHQLELLLLEIGHDESQLSETDQVFEEKLARVLAFANSLNDQVPVILIPSDFNEKRLESLGKAAKASPYINILESSKHTLHSIAWHRTITNEVVSYLDQSK